MLELLLSPKTWIIAAIIAVTSFSTHQVDSFFKERALASQKSEYEEKLSVKDKALEELKSLNIGLKDENDDMRAGLAKIQAESDKRLKEIQDRSFRQAQELKKSQQELSSRLDDVSQKYSKLLQERNEIPGKLSTSAVDTINGFSVEATDVPKTVKVPVNQNLGDVK